MLLAVLCGGFIAGTIDIGAASLINWLSPVIILQAIASGILGKPSFYDGIPSAVLGLFLQWGMALLIAAIYVNASRGIPRLRERWVVWGLAYGVVVYFVMEYVVVPLSNAWPGRHFDKPINFPKEGENLLAMCLFGLIIAFFTHRFLASGAEQPGSKPA